MAHNLAGLLFKAKQFKEAMFLEGKCIQGAKEVYGPEHMYTAAWGANYKAHFQAMKEAEADA